MADFAETNPVHTKISERYCQMEVITGFPHPCYRIKEVLITLLVALHRDYLSEYVEISKAKRITRNIFLIRSMNSAGMFEN